MTVFLQFVKTSLYYGRKEVMSSLDPRPVARPTSLIFTLYGDVVLRLDPAGSLWLGSLVRLMAPFGLSEAAVRQAVSRISRQGWLEASKQGKRAYYSVTERGRRRIEEVSPRIYGPVIEWDGRWRMIVYGIAEGRRESRDRLRKELAVLGWAPLAPSIWISPNDGLAAARAVAETSGTAASVDLFVAQYEGTQTDRELLERCWDLAAIATAYRAFDAEYRNRLEAERSGGHLTDEQAFVERLRLVNDYRKFTYLDPGLPSELIGAHWPGTQAAMVFRSYYALLEAKSLRYFRAAGGERWHVEPMAPCPNGS